jgi:YfiH family protein
MGELAFIQPNWPAPKNVRAIQTTRQGGFSQAPYDSFNLAMHVGDDAMTVAKNRQLLTPYLPSEPVWVNQVHGVTVIDAATSTCLEDADASIARQKNVVCVTMTADCLPLLMCDENGTVVAAAHAGWRGLCDGVIEATIQKMSVQPAEILVWLGPAIGSESFEVGEDVRQAFLAHDAQAEKVFKKLNAEKWLCDLYALAKQRLNALGVQRIYGASMNDNFCTFQQQNQFFSFRRDKTTGRMASLIWLV